ncbi:hypothetical protein PCASD_12687 [Puccinia coronata f. sp. avenae]|uniref:Yeast cell wall synthesis Kre9/Knh1-like N-terminal domain-containing protein n=1 Tax=Puccinia coronata f. sp. avenae TaxID=200324 RepID=A0A2N5UDY2_9BASI|nr:hypothetical protein PCASD_12687 [Puccinia coronata f. sp. avenae]
MKQSTSVRNDEKICSNIPDSVKAISFHYPTVAPTSSYKMHLFTALSAFVALASGASALTITSPSASSYWVQFVTNTIAWGTSSGDPELVSIQIINPTNKGFAGPFSIAEYVKASKLSYDVTNVQLVVGDGYQVQFINPTNNTEVLATSAQFSVKVSGTAEASVTYAPGTHESTKNSTSNSTTSTNSTNINGSSFKQNGTASANAKSLSCKAAAVPSMAIFVIGF